MQAPRHAEPMRGRVPRGNPAKSNGAEVKARSARVAAGIRLPAGVLGGVAAALLAFLPASPAGATFSGRNGALLVASGVNTSGSPFGSSAIARTADCTYPIELWRARPDGSHRVFVGYGHWGFFSPAGARLAIEFHGYFCGYGGSMRGGLFLARPNGWHRVPIKGQNLVGWLAGGALIVSRVLEAKTQLVDALTGRLLMPKPAGRVALSCSGRVAAVRDTRTGSELDIYTRKAVRTHGALRIRVVKRRVAIGARGLHGARWAPDGRSLMFARDGWWRVGVNGHGLRRLLAPDGAQEKFAMWSPDGHRILVVRVRYKNYGYLVPLKEVLVMNADGRQPHIILPYTEDENASYAGFRAIWSPDARSIAVVKPHPNDYDTDFEIVNASTGTVERTIPLKYEPTMLDWQALPGGHVTRCADRGTAPLRIQNPPSPGKG